MAEFEIVVVGLASDSYMYTEAVYEDPILRSCRYNRDENATRSRHRGRQLNGRSRRRILRRDLRGHSAQRVRDQATILQRRAASAVRLSRPRNESESEAESTHEETEGSSRNRRLNRSNSEGDILDNSNQRRGRRRGNENNERIAGEWIVLTLPVEDESTSPTNVDGAGERYHPEGAPSYMSCCSNDCSPNLDGSDRQSNESDSDRSGHTPTSDIDISEHSGDYLDNRHKNMRKIHGCHTCRGDMAMLSRHRPSITGDDIFTDVSFQFFLKAYSIYLRKT